MALSGSFSQYYVGDYFGLLVRWQGSQSVSGNYTDLTLNVYLRVRDLEVGARTGNPVAVGSETQTYDTPYMEESAGTHDVLLTTKAFRVSHDATGAKTISMSASWTFNGFYSHTYVGTMTAAAVVVLDPIPRTPTAPTVFTVSGECYYGDTLALLWSGATGYITGYELEYRDKAPDGQAWGAWTAKSAPTSATDTDAPEIPCGGTRQYRVRAMNGTLASPWKESDEVPMQGGVRLNAGGVWKTGTVYVRVGGTWRRAACAAVKSGGVWRKGT